jgi:hypothetical protein
MEPFDGYLLLKFYEKAARLGDRLAKINTAINWERARSLRPSPRGAGTGSPRWRRTG